MRVSLMLVTFARSFHSATPSMPRRYFAPPEPLTPQAAPFQARVSSPFLRLQQVRADESH